MLYGNNIMYKGLLCKGHIIKYESKKRRKKIPEELLTNKLSKAKVANSRGYNSIRLL